MKNTDYVDEFNYLVKHFVIPKIDQFELMIDHIPMIFNHLDLADKVAISNKLKEIGFSLMTMNEINQFDCILRHSHIGEKTKSSENNVNTDEKELEVF